MKTFICCSCLILIVFILFSRVAIPQQLHADKIRKQLLIVTNDTIRIKLLIKRANYAVKESEQDSCFTEAFHLADKINPRYGLSVKQFHEGVMLSRDGRYDEAIERYKKSTDGLDSLGIIQPIGYPLYKIGYLFNLTNRLTEKFQYYNEKVVYYKKFGPIQNTANCYHGLAGYYNLHSDYDQAIGYYMRSRNAFKSFDQDGFQNEEECIGSVYLSWGNLDKAEESLKSALNELIKMDKIYSSFGCLHYLGEIYYIRHDYKRAMEYYFKAKPYCRDNIDNAIILVSCAEVHLQLNSMDSAYFLLTSADKIRRQDKLSISSGRGQIEIDYNLYKYFLAQRNEKLALQNLESALQEAQAEKYLPFILKYTRELHNFMLKKGDSIVALCYLIRYHALQDSMNAIYPRAGTATYEIEQNAEAQENEIEQLQIQKANQRNYYLLGGTLLVLIVIGIINRLRYKRKRDRELLTTDFKKQLAQAETKALRSQMNPHFIFNCLNSINSFVMDQQHEIASDYLIKFSKLIRLILDNSRSETISIEKELETLKLYVLLESARFDNKFICTFNIAGQVNTNTIMIPPMLLQPFVENAIWHGLMQKEGEGTIAVEIEMEGEDAVKISITDDGIGREKAAEFKSKSATHKSHGLKVTSHRIEMMNKINSTGAQVHIFDLKDELGNAKGTRVELIIPF